MFEQAKEILHTLLIEGNGQVSPLASPLRRGADIFAYLLKELPKEPGNWPGAFGIWNLPAEEREEWLQRFQRAASHSFCYAEEPPAFTTFRQLGFSVDNGGRGHITIDYGRVLQKGLKGVYDQLDPSCEFDRAVGDALLAVRDFAGNYQCQVPWLPASDFDEALKSIWLTYECMIFSEHVRWSYSWGRMDRYLLPYAQKLSRREIKEKLVPFFRFLNEVPFKDDSCALNIGGPEGFNEVSRAIIEAVAEVRLPAPLLTVRVSRSLPDEDFKLLLRKELLTCGQPTFYGEEACRKALLRRGIPEKELNGWAANSCMGLMLPGKEWQDMWGAVLQMTTALELALNGGNFFRMAPPVECPVPVMKLEEYTDFQSLYGQVLRYIRYFFGIFVPVEQQKCANAMKHLQNAYAVPFFEDCLARKKEMRDGGVKYRTMIVETMGLANLADSLYTVQQLVFLRKKYTLAEICNALKNNFSDARELRTEILKLPKYGQNHPEINALMKQLTTDVAEIAEEFSGGGFFCAPSLHTLDTHISYGQFVAATADGRLAGEPLAKNAGTGAEVRADLTDRILSVTDWDQTRFSGGQPLDLWINPQEWEEPETVSAYTRLFRTYLERGGLQLQVNGADPEMLKAAMAHPEKYPDLSVRIGGFSVRFVTLPPRTQRDFIARFSNGI